MYSTASAKPGLLVNPLFDDWDATPEPTGWDHTTANATYVRLRKTDARDAGARTVFGQIGMRRSDADYIYAGEDGFRIEMAAAAAANDWIVRQDVAAAASLTALPQQHAVVRITARNTVAENLLNVQVIGLLDATDTHFLVPVGGTYFPGRTPMEWSQTDTQIPLIMLTKWQTWGLEIPGFPIDIDSVAVRFSNGSAGAQFIDVGECAMLENVAMLGGAA
jgi:hypothetical protein